MSYLSTSGVFTVTNITELRAVASTDVLATVRNFLGTLIYDVQEGTYTGSRSVVTGWSSDKAYVEASETLAKVIDKLGTAINESQGTVFMPRRFTFSGLTETYSLDCASDVLLTVEQVTGTFLQYWNQNVRSSSMIAFGSSSQAAAGAAFFEWAFYLGRTTRKRFYLYERDGSTPVALDDTDYVRFAAGRGGSDPSPVLDLVWGTETDGGSGIDVLSRGDSSTPAEVAVIVGERETIPPGDYDAEFSVVDDSAASPVVDPTLPIMRGVIHVIDTIGGSTGKP